MLSIYIDFELLKNSFDKVKISDNVFLHPFLLNLFFFLARFALKNSPIYFFSFCVIFLVFILSFYLFHMSDLRAHLAFLTSFSSGGLSWASFFFSSERLLFEKFFSISFNFQADFFFLFSRISLHDSRWSDKLLIRSRC